MFAYLQVVLQVLICITPSETAVTKVATFRIMCLNWELKVVIQVSKNFKS